MIPTIPFYYIIYQEYYTGVFSLPSICSPDDVSAYVALICFFTAYMGSYEFWASTMTLPWDLGDIRVSHFAVYGAFVAQTVSVLFSVLSAIF